MHSAVVVVSFLGLDRPARSRSPYHWKALAERANSLRDIGVLLLAGFGVAFANRFPCHCRSGQQGQDEEGEELDWETHLEVSATGRSVASWERKWQDCASSMFYTSLAFAWLFMVVAGLCHC